MSDNSDYPLPVPTPNCSYLQYHGGPICQPHVTLKKKNKAVPVPRKKQTHARNSPAPHNTTLLPALAAPGLSSGRSPLPDHAVAAALAPSVLPHTAPARAPEFHPVVFRSIPSATDRHRRSPISDRPPPPGHTVAAALAPSHSTTTPTSLPLHPAAHFPAQTPATSTPVDGAAPPAPADTAPPAPAAPPLLRLQRAAPNSAPTSPSGL